MNTPIQNPDNSATEANNNRKENIPIYLIYLIAVMCDSTLFSFRQNE